MSTQRARSSAAPAAVAATLPSDVKEVLHRAYADYITAVERRSSQRLPKGERVARLLHAGHKAGWPNHALGDAMGITATSAARITKRFDVEDMPPLTRPKFPVYEDAGSSSSRATKSRAKAARVLTAEEKQELAELAALARTCTGSRPLTHPSRVASVKFSDRLKTYHTDGVTWQELADASGMKISGVRMRATRHGYNSGPPPSIAPFRNVVRGHADDVVEEPAPVAEPKRSTAKKATAKKVAKPRVAAKPSTAARKKVGASQTG